MNYGTTMSADRQKRLTQDVAALKQEVVKNAEVQRIGVLAQLAGQGFSEALEALTEVVVVNDVPVPVLKKTVCEQLGIEYAGVLEVDTPDDDDDDDDDQEKQATASSAKKTPEFKVNSVLLRSQRGQRGWI